MRYLLLAAALFAAAPAAANDTTAVLGTGGLVFVSNDTLKMDSEDLFVSPEAVRVTYEFTNTADVAQDVLVAFPMPDIEGSGDFNVAVPHMDSDNLFGFATSFNGKAVKATLHQQAFMFNLDQTAALEELGVPLTPFGERTRAALAGLDEKGIDRLMRLGLIVPMDYSDDGDNWKRSYEPVWTLRSTYSWQAHFEPGETAEVIHTYAPSVGGTVAVTFLSPADEYGDRAAEYKKKYCTDDSFIKAVKKTLATPTDYYSAPFTESWISYVWSTGNNWAGPIGRFTLTIDKGAPGNLVSFCWDGAVKKTGPTTFRMEATDWYPPWDHELEILILNRYEREEMGG